MVLVERLISLGILALEVILFTRGDVVIVERLVKGGSGKSI